MPLALNNTSCIFLVFGAPQKKSNMLPLNVVIKNT